MIIFYCGIQHPFPSFGKCAKRMVSAEVSLIKGRFRGFVNIKTGTFMCRNASLTSFYIEDLPLCNKLYNSPNSR